MNPKTWTVTLRTGVNTWSKIEVPGVSPEAAIRRAKRLLGDYPCSEIV